MPPVPDPLDLAQALIRCPSVTPADAGAMDVAASALERLGFTCHRLSFGELPIANLYARWGSRGRNFCFAGHTDVVPVGNAADWSVDAFAGTVRDGALIGRGAADMKGGVAAFMAAAARFVAGRDPEGGNSVSLLLTGDEEGVARDGTRRVLEWLDERGERLDACLVGEPSSREELGDMLKIGRRGSLTGRLTVLGTAGHSAYPDLADNPIHRLVAMLADLVSAPLDHPTEHFEASTLQVTTIDVGNPASNVIPAAATAVFNSRFNDRWTGATLEAHLRDRLARHGGRWELEVVVSGESFLTPPGHLADLVAAATEKITGRRPVYSTTGGTSDARFIHRFCPVVELGLVGRTMHKPDESVPVADLKTLTRVYAEVLESYFRDAG